MRSTRWGPDQKDGQRMSLLSPGHAALLADVQGEALFLVGGRLGWSWVRNLALRVTHLVVMVVIALQAWLGALCPLTVWEQALRRHAGESAYRESFIEYWLSRVLYFDLPWWVFVAAYTAFAALVLMTWRWVPPRRRRA